MGADGIGERFGVVSDLRLGVVPVARLAHPP
jgi:hypothetical protein